MRSIEQFNKQLENQLDKQVSAFFTDQELDQLAQQTQFTQRKVNKLSGSTFFKLIIFNNDTLSEQSLNSLCVNLAMHEQINITEQSLNERFNNHALNFLKRALEEVLTNQIADKVVFTNQCCFKRILIKDSTCFQIDESLSEIYPGSGGAASKASVRIQFEYDILCGTITALAITPFIIQDATDSKNTIIELQAGDLIIRDLAYMSNEVLKSIIEAACFFLCRPMSNVIMFEYLDEQRKVIREINFVSLREYMKQHHLNRIEKLVLLGKEKTIQVRLIICLLPSEIASKRIHTFNRNSKGKKHSSEYRARAFFNLFITNAPKEFLCDDQAAPLYTIRWQIELLFKIWKSIAHIDKVKKVKQERFECYIHAKLIIILLCWRLFWNVNKYIYKNDKILVSGYKFFKTILNNIKDFSTVWLNESFENQVIVVYNLCQLSAMYLLCETKGSDSNYIEIILNALHHDTPARETDSIKSDSICSLIN